MALGPQVIDLVGFDVMEEVRELPRDGQVPVMEVHPGLRVVEILVEVVDPVRIEGARPPDQAVHCIALAQQKLGQVGPVLAGDARDECCLHVSSIS